jgi:hypothetical protein
MKRVTSITSALLLLIFTSCNSNPESRLQNEREEITELLGKMKVNSDSDRIEQERIEQEKKDEEERANKQIYDKYMSNSLHTGAMPYSKYYRRNASCEGDGCSQIKVKTSNSDVVITIKKNGKVVRHAFIRAGDSYTFSFANGTYQAFFYYGEGWYPEKEMKGGKMKGGFISNEQFGKDDPQYLKNNVLTYELTVRQNGNFSTRPSNPEEAL